MVMQTAFERSEIFMFDPRAETMPRTAIAALQTSRARQTLERAYANVAQYRRTFDAAGVKPADFTTLADIARFPLTVKADLRDTYPFGMFAVPRKHYCACTPRPAPPESRPSSATPAAISTAGAT